MLDGTQRLFLGTELCVPRTCSLDGTRSSKGSPLPPFKLVKEIIHAQVSRRHHWRHISYRLGRGGSSPDADLLMPETAGAGRRFRLLVVTLFLGLLLLLANRAMAQEGAETVRLDGRALFSVSSSDTLGAEERARRVEQRLGVLVRALETVPEAAVDASGDQRVIVVAGVRITTVSPIDAEDSLTDIDTLAARWANAIEMGLRDAVDRRQGFGGSFFADTLAALQTVLSRAWNSVVSVVPRLLAAALVMGTTLLIASGVNRVLVVLFKRRIADKTLENLIRQLSYYSLILLGVLVAADALGFSPGALVTGLGLTGLVLGFALKDILSNFVSGLLILALRPFEIGDQIVVGPTEGSVERIELRATQIRTYDGRVALVPNAEVFTSRIVNNTADPIRRGNVLLQVGYNTDFDTLVERLRGSVASVQGVLDDRPVTVRIDELAADAITMNIGFWTDSLRSDYKQTTSDVRRHIASTMEDMGLPLPEPDLWRVAPAHLEEWKIALSSRREPLHPTSGAEQSDDMKGKSRK
ncbi:MAG: mechanosensitive ion channel [Alphaproteobacteria bacterium]|nr:mechanosensitive ion channel [Alphaproteobacteria bacterium]MBU1765525.1 mechanosensitive ion channel [Alphaproteobacteria bacterium]